MTSNVCNAMREEESTRTLYMIYYIAVRREPHVSCNIADIRKTACVILLTVSGIRFVSRMFHSYTVICLYQLFASVI